MTHHGNLHFHNLFRVFLVVQTISQEVAKAAQGALDTVCDGFLLALPGASVSVHLAHAGT
jgi:hypothetical protein